MGCAPGVTLHKKPSTVTLGNGWAANSINTVVFRKNSLASIGDTQYIAWYNQEGFVVLGKRILPAGKWTTVVTRFKGNVSDAHNTICIMPDGDGYLHIAWDHHNNALRYCKSIAPGSLELTDKMPMTDTLDSRVTYPEFHRLPNGNLLFLYRNGQSGEGNLVINRYDIHTRKWTRLHSNLIDGEGQRNAYWQACTDEKGTIHVSWVWRETSDVASNHDLCYARSTDAGATWEKSNGDQYQLPINGASAEYICHIPQKMELINQTAMSADAAGNPLIASYWREANDAVPQYHVVFRQNNKWVVQNTGFRKTAFSLSGAGTKRIPISRPQIISWKKKQRVFTAIVFRDEERGNKISIAYNNDSSKSKWQVRDLLREGVGSWEPTYDTEWWKRKKSLHLFVQLTDQQDGEGKSNIAPQPVSVLQWNP
ncbi:MAG: BNR repeat-containing protein [Chitinophagaceae bacterium]